MRCRFGAGGRVDLHYRRSRTSCWVDSTERLLGLLCFHRSPKKTFGFKLNPDLRFGQKSKPDIETKNVHVHQSRPQNTHFDSAAETNFWSSAIIAAVRGCGHVHHCALTIGLIPRNSMEKPDVGALDPPWERACLSKGEACLGYINLCSANHGYLSAQARGLER